MQSIDEFAETCTPPRQTLAERVTAAGLAADLIRGRDELGLTQQQLCMWLEQYGIVAKRSTLGEAIRILRNG